jgi:hypothetical protein
MTGYNDIHDNRDLEVLPNFECTTTDIRWLVTFEGQFGSTTRDWLFDHYEGREVICHDLFAERTNGRVVSAMDSQGLGVLAVAAADRLASYTTVSEMVIRKFWNLAKRISHQVKGIDWESKPRTLGESLDELSEYLQSLRQDWESGLNLPDPTIKPEEMYLHHVEPYMARHYGHLEVFLVFWRFCDLFDEQRKKRDIPLKNKTKENVVKLIRTHIQACYDALRKFVQAWVDYYKRHGKDVIKAKVRQGTSGEVLKDLISDGDLNRYAQLYVDSGIDTLRGLLNVKLKK